MPSNVKSVFAKNDAVIQLIHRAGLALVYTFAPDIRTVLHSLVGNRGRRQKIRDAHAMLISRSSSSMLNRKKTTSATCQHPIPHSIAKPTAVPWAAVVLAMWLGFIPRKNTHWFCWENLHRKPMGFYHQIGWAFRFKIFPSSNSMKHRFSCGGETYERGGRTYIDSCTNINVYYTSSTRTRRGGSCLRDIYK